ncbi:hypothetical protein RIEGSTA812A_PEG_974 [invertebrate metagenome]|uniref:Uncharacterized protein n=1 Tax=invertebrate metagenome TaxID=1711999 RepID=A0A484H7I6_9ZZZZ
MEEGVNNKRTYSAFHPYGRLVNSLQLALVGQSGRKQAAIRPATG